ncbi:MAG: multicopper oxidase [Saprospiraceae bacterium]|nr:MAG: multicopper oxidase [Saprospiraceae bacterium]
MKNQSPHYLWGRSLPLLIILLFSYAPFLVGQAPANGRAPAKIIAKIVVLEQPLIYNRLGSMQPEGLMYALESDVVPVSDRTITIEQNGQKVTKSCKELLAEANAKGQQFCAGCVQLRPDKRPRPIVLRANEGDLLEVTLTNLIMPPLKPNAASATQLQTNPTANNAPAAFNFPEVGFSVNGMQFVEGIADDGSWVSSNGDNQVGPGESKTFQLLGEKEGTFLIRDAASDALNAAETSNFGLFGSVVVEPKGAEWYRSQVTNQDIYYATTGIRLEDGTMVQKGDAAFNRFVNNNQLLENSGYPIINYAAKYPEGPKKGQYILRMLGDNNELIYTDLTAVITGPNAGRFPATETGPLFDSIPASPDRRQPFREICIHYHNIFSAVQAFDKEMAYLGGTNTGGEAFAFNYGSAGISNEIFANRVEVGPMADCVECKYEEFFLSSWSVGDPSMIVDVNATESLRSGKTRKATLAKYPDDPSNVYHSYIWDHVKFRIHHASQGVTHVHHFHAHQWLHSPNSAKGHYLDSQTLNPGASYTLELVHNGTGNKNLTVGDNIFHCHFYPHFAAGMWALFRAHDVLELGTRLNERSQPAANSRALPDGEIVVGTPIPGLLPMPTKAMAPVPGAVHIEDGQPIVSDLTKNPGFPFFIPGIAGSRPPHPPLDFAYEVDEKNDTTFLDGGLPRHIIKGGNISWEQHTLYDWTKEADTLIAIKLPEDGTPVEKAAMKAHATRNHSTFRPDGKSDSFTLNGRPPAPGAPFADPVVTLDGDTLEKIPGEPNPVPITKRTYKAANIQMDVVLNKKGWHYPQQRIIALWQDVKPTLDGTRPPEPFFFRANSNEYIEFWHSNLVPAYFELDNFQVRTPTDVLGQHIHLVKFDVTSSDGAANGFNYEDGTFSPDEVRDRISGINNGEFIDYRWSATTSVKTSPDHLLDTIKLKPTASLPVWGSAPANQDWTGAQTTLQRWYADPLYDLEGSDRTIRTVFTHDHFSPSTHQQVGLYAGLLVEPRKSRWLNSETGAEMGKREDGGPTSFQAIIETAPDSETESYREFALEFQELQLAYTAESKADLSPYPAIPSDATTNQSFLQSVAAYNGWFDAPFAISPPSVPQIISQGGSIGTYSVNYRNEPMFLRLSDPASQRLGEFKTAAYPAGDASFGYSSQIERADPAFNKQPQNGSYISPYNNVKYPKHPLTPGMQDKDPFTPLLRAYENDRIQVRTLVGAHEVPHIFAINDLPWLFEPSNENSGYRSSQMMSISEHFEMNFSLPGNNGNPTADYLYNTSTDNAGINGGVWGMIRSYPKNSQQDSLAAMSTNAIGSTSTKDCGCPDNAPVRSFTVEANLVATLNAGKPLVYNTRDTLFDPNAMVFVKRAEAFNGKPIPVNAFPSGHFEPLVLRARAGECIEVLLENKIDPSSPYFKEVVQVGYTNTQEQGNGRDFQLSITASPNVGMHAQLLSYDPNKSDGMNVGMNDSQSVAPGASRKYAWYAGRWEKGTPIDMEYGTVLLTSSDVMEQYARGLFGALVIEPKGATWTADQGTEVSATVKHQDQQFREFVIFHQDNVIQKTIDGSKTVSADNTFAVNFRSEPLLYRYFANAEAVSRAGGNPSFNILNLTYNDAANPKGADQQMTYQLTYDGTANNSLEMPRIYDDPETAIFVAGKGVPVRLRLLKPGGAGNPETFLLTGHGFQEEPYKDGSSVIGDNPESQWFGSRPQMAGVNCFDVVIDQAGGEKAVIGDYLYRIYQTGPFTQGMWGLVRVTDGHDAVTLTRITPPASGRKGRSQVTVTTTVDPNSGQYPKAVTLVLNNRKYPATGGQDQGNGIAQWTISNIPQQTLRMAKNVTILTNTGGSRQYTGEELAPLYLPGSQEQEIYPVELLQLEFEADKQQQRFLKPTRVLKSE